ncbi:MAG TPA: nitroreductase family protein [Acidimicrobiales bacterium]|nr:nitroreductase family protein [Acidimicrobiales bacterium]
MDLHESIRKRRMVRAYEPGRAIPDDVLRRVLDAARRAPAAGNSAQVDLLVIDEPERFWSLTFPGGRGAPEGSARSTFRWQGLFDAPTVVVPIVDPGAYVARYSEPDKAHAGLAHERAWDPPYWWVDGGMAVENLLLAATAEGLGALFFGLFGWEERVLGAFGVPEDRRALGALTLGWPLPDEPSASVKRGRRPLDEVVHRNHW